MRGFCRLLCCVGQYRSRWRARLWSRGRGLHLFELAGYSGAPSAVWLCVGGLLVSLNQTDDVSTCFLRAFVL